MAANQDNEESPSDSSQEHPLTSLEDTGESGSLQEQETPPTQNNGTAKPQKAAPAAARKHPKGSPEAVVGELKKYALELNDYLAWKEDLRITTIDLQIGGPYFTLWTQEANLFFRRLVILKKRSERAKSKQRA
ncbi:MAG: hypothetical protein V4655_01520 [Bdellovibrionota bacterium]